MGGRVDEPTGGECQAKPAPTIWKIPDDVWEIAVEILDREYPKRVKGHRRVDLRPIVNGILYRLRTGCQWNHLPKEFGDDSTIHRPFQAMCVRESVGSVGREVRRTRRRRLGMAGRRRLDGEGARKVSDGSRCGWQEPHRPRKKGVKWSLLVERTGSPLSIVIAGANVHDTKFWMQLWTPSWCADPPPWTTRSICAWAEATTTQRARPQCATTNTSVTLASVPDSRLMRQTGSGIRRGVGLSNAPSRGCRSSEAF